MKAAQLIKYGDDEAIVISDIPKPSIAPGKVLVEIYAAGVNPVDWKIRSGFLEKMMPALPVILGGDFSGCVVEVGDSPDGGVSDFQPGDEVFGTALVLAGGSGSFAEFALCDVKAIARKPKNIGHNQAVALPLAGVSAQQALVEHMNLSRDQRILIHGGAGGIGTFAIQLAKHLGAQVVTTASGNDIDYVKSLGADQAIDYQTQKFEEVLKDFDAVFDTVGGETYARSYQVLKKGGVIVSMLEQPNQELMQKYGVKAISQFTQINQERLSSLSELAVKGVIKVHIDKIFALNKAAEALSHLEKKHPLGKIVLEI